MKALSKCPICGAWTLADESVADAGDVLCYHCMATDYGDPIEGCRCCGEVWTIGADGMRQERQIDEDGYCSECCARIAS